MYQVQENILICNLKHQAMVHVPYQTKYRVLILGGICSCAIYHGNVCNFQW